ncbi:hypothetical protein N2152v2_007326 [Parachlorella kessleri]
MEALFDTCKQMVIRITTGCLSSEVYAEECLKLARYVSKCALVLTEIELTMHVDPSLRGSQSLFRAIDGLIVALKQAAQLAEQCSSAKGGGVWPLEDAVEFQATALELQNGMQGLAKVKDPLPQDIVEDLQHFLQQLGGLQFTTSELAESEAVVETSTAQLAATPRAKDTSEDVEGSPFKDAVVPAEVLAAPTPAPAGQAGAPARLKTKTDDAAAGEAAAEEEQQQPGSPLPDDPFNMDDRLQSSTVRELEDLKLEPEGGGGAEGEGAAGGLGEESLLEARPDTRNVLAGEQPPPAGALAAGLAGLRELAQAGKAAGGQSGSAGRLEGIEEATEDGTATGTGSAFGEAVEVDISLSGEEEEEQAGDGEGEEGGEEEVQMGELVEGVVALVEEGEDEEEGPPGGQQAEAGAAAGEQAQHAQQQVEPSNGQAVKRKLSPASALAELAASSLDHFAHGEL